MDWELSGLKGRNAKVVDGGDADLLFSDQLACGCEGDRCDCRNW